MDLRQKLEQQKFQREQMRRAKELRRQSVANSQKMEMSGVPQGDG